MVMILRRHILCFYVIKAFCYECIRFTFGTKQLIETEYVACQELHSLELEV